MSHYTDADVQMVGMTIDATMPLHGSEDDQITYAARAVLDAVAPAIAARALRNEADKTFGSTPSAHLYDQLSRTELRYSADEIERGAS